MFSLCPCGFIPAAMWSAWLLPFFLVPGAGHNHHTHLALTCVNDYLANISCEWEGAASPPGHICNLKGNRKMYSGDVNKDCVLDTTRGCWIDFGQITFNFEERINLEVHCNNTIVYKLDYRPGHHVKLHPPEQLHVSGGNLTWNRGARFPSKINQYVFELQVKAKHQRWEEVRPSLVDGMFAMLDDGSPCKGSECEARVRVRPKETKKSDRIQGQWSDWSSPVSWKSVGLKVTTAPPIHEVINMFTTGIIVGCIVLILTVLLSVTYYIYNNHCIWKAGHVPDPSKFFQPLIDKHKGNFQQWLGPHHSTPVFLPPQPCDCEISPVDEVSKLWDDALCSDMLFLYGNQQTSGSSVLSSGISNMGYFYSEHQPGSLCLDTCPVYFTYQPEEGPIESTSSYEHLEGEYPLSPDSGFGVGVERDEVEEDEQEEDDEERAKVPAEECSGVNVKHLVSFFLSFPDNTDVPSFFVEPSPKEEEDEVCGSGVATERSDDAVVRSSSLVVQPCSSGYLTLKEMQKYSNKSI